MSKRMLIDTTHAEETRVVVLDGNRLEDYDVETSAKKQLKSNIYLAKIVRVEPSLQAAFVEYGGNRHGFLAFSEIHPDYYQIPVADRERLLALQEEEARAEEAREDAREAAREAAGGTAEDDEDRNDELPDRAGADGSEPETDRNSSDSAALDIAANENNGAELQAYGPTSDEQRADEPAPESIGGENDSSDDARSSQQSARFLRQYKIQEVIRRRQILLIQVVKEERGNKGAALTTYISLAGRFCVLMPNSLRGGGVSRKITSAADRRRLKDITNELEIPRGMAMIIRTAGAQRPRPEIRRDCEYLLQLWDDIREQTLRAMAPALIYEEANLIKRAIRDVYTRDIEEIAVDGEQGWKAAREFMRNLMPANAQKVTLWRDHGEPLFSYYQVEHHLDAMLQPTVQLRSGGYLVINQTEALVAIDVNSGRSTRERGIEETALRTNLEAADEVARQLRLRDLAGLIVIDFIDMEARRHNVMVERRLKEALKNDRARIQLGTISHFGLMEMSRQRLRPSIAESSFVACPHCSGTGFVRGTDSAALHVLRAIEEEGGKQRAGEIQVSVASSVALFILNNKRVWLAEIEQRHRMTVNFAADDSLIPPQLRIEKVRAQVTPAAIATSTVEVAAERRLPANGVITHGVSDPFEAEAEAEDFERQDPEERLAAAPEAASQPGAAPGAQTAESSDEEHRRKRRRRRRRGGRREDGAAAAPADGNAVNGHDVLPQDAEQPAVEHGDAAARVRDDGRQRAFFEGSGSEPGADDDGDQELGLGEPGMRGTGEVPLSQEQGGAPRKRGRRGGARGRKPREADQDAATDRRRVAQPAYDGPTPANPFAGSYDIFELIEQDMEPTRAVAIEPETPPAPVMQAEIMSNPVVETPVAGTPVVEASVVEALVVEASVVETHGAETPAPEAFEPHPEPASNAAVPDSPLANPLIEALAEATGEAPTEIAKPKRKRASAPPSKAVAAAPGEASTGPGRSKAAASKAAGDKAAGGKPAAPRMTKARKAELAAAAAADASQASMIPETLDAAEGSDGRVAGNVVQPVLIDNVTPPPARRTGWWKR